MNEGIMVDSRGVSASRLVLFRYFKNFELRRHVKDFGL
jgi:hypothetical protein